MSATAPSAAPKIPSYKTFDQLIGQTPLVDLSALLDPEAQEKAFQRCECLGQAVAGGGAVYNSATALATALARRAHVLCIGAWAAGLGRKLVGSVRSVFDR